MNGSYTLFVSTITTLITQLFNTFWTLFTRAFSILTRSSATPPPTDLPIAVHLRLAVNVGSETTSSGHAQRYPREQAINKGRNSAEYGPPRAAGPNLNTRGRDPKLNPREAIKGNIKSLKPKRLSHDLFPAPACTIMPQHVAQVKGCDAVLDIIDAVMKSNSGHCSEMVDITSVLADSPVSQSPVSRLSVSEPFSWSLHDDTPLSTPNPSPPETPPSRPTSFPTLCASPQSLSIPVHEVDPMIGELGKRRGFKGAPIRTRTPSLPLPRKLSQTFLNPRNPVKSFSTSNQPLVSQFVIQAVPSPLNERASVIAPNDSVIGPNPFAMDGEEPFYTPDSMPIDASTTNLDNFSAYRTRTARKKLVARPVSSTRGLKSLLDSQPTVVHDMSVYSYVAEENRTRTPMFSEAEVEFTHPRARMTSEVEITLTPPSPTKPSAIPAPASCAAQITPTGTESEHWNAAALSEVTFPVQLGNGPSLDLELFNPISGLPLDSAASDIDFFNDSIPSYRRHSGLKPLILPQRHKLGSSYPPIQNLGARLQTLEGTIDLVDPRSESRPCCSGIGACPKKYGLEAKVKRGVLKQLNAI